jgi:hypothetical protein
MPPAVLIALLILALVFLFLPTGIAFAKGSADRIPIFGVNLVFFYSVIIWGALMVWAVTGRRDESLFQRAKTAGGRRWLAPVLLVLLSVGILIAIFIELPRTFSG